MACLSTNTLSFLNTNTLSQNCDARKTIGRDVEIAIDSNHFCSVYFFAFSENATERSCDDVAWRHLLSGKKCFAFIGHCT
ncbi:unnamed protein product [Brugia pahangi]|uniref:Uncharacterized protein n=1 Tax=Brugia pahangi TaxID=6280 RepID=A0A0N4T228_BRUPA|nr:unnamed protein product [Brugia pahangi]